MNKKPSPFLPLLLSLAFAGPALAETSEKHVIALKTGDFELAETDVSDLAIGEAETIVTESGKTVDIIRTAEGFDIFVDGEQLEMPRLSDSEHRVHSKEVIVECVAEGEEASECEDEIIIHTDGEELEFADLHEDDLHFNGSVDGKVIRIHRAHGGEADGESHERKVIVIKESAENGEF